MSGWRPILEGEQAARAFDAACAVAADLSRLPVDTSVEGVTLKHGHLGPILLFEWLRRAGQPGWTAARDRFLDAVLGALAERPLRASLYWGFPGIAWTTLQVAPDEDLTVIDEVLAETVAGDADDLPFDLMDGLCGVGMYLLERRAAASAARVVSLLEQRAQRDSQGLYWQCESRQLHPVLAKAHPEGYVQLGAAHGVAGAIAFLSDATAAGVVPVTRTRGLVENAVSWLIARHGAGARFPTDKQGALVARDAWCQGAPSIAAMLWRAGEVFDREDWRSFALVTARTAAARTAEEGAVVDAGLCHGAAGLAHIYNRLHQASGDSALAGATRAWFERALAMRTPGLGLGGFRTFDPPRSPEQPWVADPGFLGGSAGVALALLAAATDVEPLWDRLLLLDLDHDSVASPERIV